MWKTKIVRKGRLLRIWVESSWTIIPSLTPPSPVFLEFKKRSPDNEKNVGATFSRWKRSRKFWTREEESRRSIDSRDKLLLNLESVSSVCESFASCFVRWILIYSRMCNMLCYSLLWYSDVLVCLHDEFRIMSWKDCWFKRPYPFLKAFDWCSLFAMSMSCCL